MRVYQLLVSFPHRLQQSKLNNEYARFLNIFKKLEINIPFAKALAQMPHYAKFMKDIINRKRNLDEGAQWKFCRVAKIRNLKISQVAKFRRLRTFVGCEISQHCSPVCACCLLLFDPPFCGFIQVCPSCNFGSLAHFCNFLILSTYISSVFLVNQSTFTPSINQVGMKLPPLYWFCDFLALSLIFLVAKHPLMMTNQGEGH